MSIQAILVIIEAFCVNVTIMSVLPAIVYFMIRFPKFALWVKNGIEDSDDKPHKQDQKDLVLLFLGSIFAWIMANTIFISQALDKDFTAAVLVELGIVATLFGISKITNISKS